MGEAVGKTGARRACQPYRGMRVWDAGGGAPLVFDADALGERQLGGSSKTACWSTCAVAALCRRRRAPALPGGRGRWRRTPAARVGLDDGQALERGWRSPPMAGRPPCRMAGIEPATPTASRAGRVRRQRTCAPGTPAGSVSCPPAGRLLPFATDGAIRARRPPRLDRVDVADAEATRLVDAAPEVSMRAGAGLRRRAGGLCVCSRRGPASVARQLADDYVARARAGRRCGPRDAPAGRAGREPGPATSPRCGRWCARPGRTPATGNPARLARWAPPQSENAGELPSHSGDQPRLQQRRPAAHPVARACAGASPASCRR